MDVAAEATRDAIDPGDQSRRHDQSPARLTRARRVYVEVERAVGGLEQPSKRRSAALAVLGGDLASRSAAARAREGDDQRGVY